MCINPDLLDIIWDFAYKVRTTTSPMVDIMWVMSIQRAVPPIFLRTSVPAFPTFDLQWEFLKEQEFAYSTLYIPNPFVRGNPYFPSNGLCTYVNPWSFTPYRLIQILSRDSVKNVLRTYPAILMRKASQLFSSSIVYWNHAYLELWSRETFSDENSFRPENSADVELIALSCHQLRMATLF